MNLDSSYRARGPSLVAMTFLCACTWAVATYGAESTAQPTAAPPIEPVTWVSLPWALLAIAAVFGAIGGVVYELVALQGNIEWPHRTVKEELPFAGLGHATVAFLFDLGFMARIIVGAAAAIVIYWMLPVVPGVRLVAIALIAGSAGTAVFRSLQDRLIAALNAAKADTLTKGLEEIRGDVGTFERAAASVRGAPTGVVEGAGAVDLQVQAAKIRGRIEALLELGKRH